MPHVYTGSACCSAIVAASHILSKPVLLQTGLQSCQCPKLRHLSALSGQSAGSDSGLSCQHGSANGCSVRHSSTTAGRKEEEDGGVRFQRPESPTAVRSAAQMASRSLIYRDVRTLLTQVGGDPREARYWLTQFQNSNTANNQPFAVVQVDEEVFSSKEALYNLSFGLSFLQRMDMKPIVILGQDIQEDIEGSLCSVSEAKAQLVKNCKILTDSLQRNSASVIPFFNGGSLLHVNEEPSSYSIGSTVTVEMDLLRWSLESGNIPIICPIGETPSGQSVLLDSLDVTGAISRTLNPLKVMFLNNTGGIRDPNKKVICQVNLPADINLLTNASWMNNKVWKQSKLIVDLLNHLPVDCSAVITSAETLLTELFSHKGSGTLFKNAEPIRRYKSLDELDLDRLKSLINKSFGKSLREDYFSAIENKLHSIYLSEGYSAAAIITLEPIFGGIPYLDKFVISSSKQGQGASEMLWECIRRDLNLLFWRSRVTNRINPWYFKHCDGSFTNGEWIVFWLGLSDIRQSYELVDHAKSLPDSFFKPGTLPQESVSSQQ
ncbi:N-acetylglutamate synthase, mitochondrial [Protopterus annectens]|uniref:N-acetylglutamate synthase, mitochondrial n=1 Tax=Protopterus annectens TaxID=7888 RepID=UPI001CFB3F04|nr:N-acetylglutamate synthase, mitochondrial [Protopterus annectens]